MATETYDLIDSGTLSGSSVTISGLPTTYKDFIVQLDNVYSSTGDRSFKFECNSLTSGYTYVNVNGENSTINKTYALNSSSFLLPTEITQSSPTSIRMTFFNVADTSTVGQYKPFIVEYGGLFKSVGSAGGYWNSSSNAMTSLKLYCFNDSFDGGTWAIWGVSE